MATYLLCAPGTVRTEQQTLVTSCGAARWTWSYSKHIVDTLHSYSQRKDYRYVIHLLQLYPGYLAMQLKNKHVISNKYQLLWLNRWTVCSWFLKSCSPSTLLIQYRRIRLSSISPISPWRYSLSRERRRKNQVVSCLQEWNITRAVPPVPEPNVNQRAARPG